MVQRTKWEVKDGGTEPGERLEAGFIWSLLLALYTILGSEDTEECRIQRDMTLMFTHWHLLLGRWGVMDGMTQEHNETVFAFWNVSTGYTTENELDESGRCSPKSLTTATKRT